MPPETATVPELDWMYHLTEWIAEVHPIFITGTMVLWLGVGVYGALKYRLLLDEEDVTVNHLLSGIFILRCLPGLIYIIAALAVVLYRIVDRIDCIMRDVQLKYGDKVLMKTPRTEKKRHY